MKNGIASMTKLSMPRAICCDTMTPGSDPCVSTKTSVASTRTKPMGSPPNSVTTRAASISAPDEGNASGNTAAHAM